MPGANMTMRYQDRIVVDPQICFGKPTIRGHRIWVSLVLGYLAEGWTTEQIVNEFAGDRKVYGLQKPFFTNELLVAIRSVQVE